MRPLKFIRQLVSNSRVPAACGPSFSSPTNLPWLNGKRLARDVEQALPERSEIGIAEVLKLSFEARR